MISTTHWYWGKVRL